MKGFDVFTMLIFHHVHGIYYLFIQIFPLCCLIGFNFFFPGGLLDKLTPVDRALCSIMFRDWHLLTGRHEMEPIITLCLTIVQKHLISVHRRFTSVLGYLWG